MALPFGFLPVDAYKIELELTTALFGAGLVLATIVLTVAATWPLSHRAPTASLLTRTTRGIPASAAPFGRV